MSLQFVKEVRYLTGQMGLANNALLIPTPDPEVVRGAGSVREAKCPLLERKKKKIASGLNIRRKDILSILSVFIVL